MNSRPTVGGRSRWLPWTVLGLASVLLVGSVTFAVADVGQSYVPAGPDRPVPVNHGGQPSPGSGLDGRTRGVPGGMMGTGNGAGNGMMGGRVWLAGNGTAVTTIAAARARAVEAGAPSGLHPGEVMQFSLNFYVELKDATGSSIAEVLVDPSGGAVVTEYGPAMMWTATNATALISPARATDIANKWLGANTSGEVVDGTDLFPGHYTMDTMSGGHTVGMLSVNAITGAVWYHTWHGTFIAKEDA